MMLADCLPAVFRWVLQTVRKGMAAWKCPDIPARFPQLKEINGLFAFLLHFADKTVVDFNLLGAGVAFVFYGFMDDNLLDQGIQQFGSQF